MDATIVEFQDMKTLCLSGHVRHEDRAALRRVCVTASEKQEPHLVVDLSEVLTLDLSCVGVLEDLATDVLEVGAEAAFVVTSPALWSLLLGCGLRPRIRLVGTQREAIQLIHAA